MINIKIINIENKFECSFNKINTLVIENPKLFRDTIINFLDALQGDSSKIIITKNNDIYKIRNDIVLVNNYFDYNLSKKINSAVNKSLLEKISLNSNKYQQYYQQGYSLFTDLFNDYNASIDINDELDVSLLIKLFNPNIIFDCSNSNDRLDSLIKYINALIEFFNLKIVIFVELESYFSIDEIEMIYKHCCYKQVSLFLLQSYHKYNLSNEKVVIIDKDLCEIDCKK